MSASYVMEFTSFKTTVSFYSSEKDAKEVLDVGNQFKRIISEHPSQNHSIPTSDTDRKALLITTTFERIIEFIYTA